MSALLLGHPALRSVCLPVDDVHAPAFRAEAGQLIEALEAFRAEHGFGRAMAAPQIGIPKRFIAMNLGEGPFLLINPEVTWRSAETFTMYDDCMSFPWLLVRLRRHASVSVSYRDEAGAGREWTRVGRELSEPLQHELDHLDGVLALDRALGPDALVARQTFEAMRDHFAAQVDYTIPALPGRSP